MSFVSPTYALTSRFVRIAATVGLTGALCGCASTALDAQWADAQLPPALLRGARVMVVCEAQDVVIQRLCQDRVVAGLITRGATPVLPPPTLNIPLAQSVIDPELLRTARGANVRAVFAVTVGVSARTVSPGMSLSLGGFGFGSRVGGGVGVSAPIGGGQVSSGYSANGRVTEVASGRLLWTARATTPPASNLNDQVTELAQTVLEAADKANLF